MDNPIHRLGFVAQAGSPAYRDPADLRLAVDCPFCRRPATYPGLAGDGSAALAECDACDVDFDFAPGEVYATGAPEVGVAVDAA